MFFLFFYADKKQNDKTNGTQITDPQLFIS